MFTKLYPFSKKNIVKLDSYIYKIEEQGDIAEQCGKYEKAEKLFNEANHLRAIIHEGQIAGDEKVLWVTGPQIATLKKIIA